MYETHGGEPEAPINILYSFYKKGFEADYWTREIAAASSSEFTFIPFNQTPYLDVWSYMRAQLLDNLYYARHPGLMRLYADFEALIRDRNVSALIVDTCPPFHPDYLRKIPVYKALRTSDGPITAYDRDIPYCHAYDHVLYHSPAYSRDMGMLEKLRYCKVERADFWPMCAFDALCDSGKTEETILSHERDIDVIFIGTLHVTKMALLAKVKKALGPRIKIAGFAPLKHNAYFNLKHGFPGWIRPVPFDQYVTLYQRSKIGINVHNRGDHTVGSYRMFDLPANGVMQISDGGPYLSDFYAPGEEIEGYSNADADELIDKVRHYLARDEDRRRIALGGYRRVMRDYRAKTMLRKAGAMIREGMRRSA